MGTRSLTIRFSARLVRGQSGHIIAGGSRNERVDAIHRMRVGHVEPRGGMIEACNCLIGGRMGKAEDAAHRHTAVAAQQAVAEAAQRETEALKRNRAVSDKVAAEVRQALARLEAKDFKGAELLKKRRFGMTREYASWRLSTGLWPDGRGGTNEGWVRLYSDGTLRSPELQYPSRPDRTVDLTTMNPVALDNLLESVKKLGV